MKRLIPALLGLFLFFSLAIPAEASIPVEEGNLAADGGVYEVNPDLAGWLWISDWSKGDVWRLNPETGAYTVYSTGGNPADARGSGSLFWWVDNNTNFIGRADVATGAYTRWQVPNAKNLYATEIDTSQAGSLRIWATDETQSFIYRLSVNTAGTSGELCNYELPLSGMPGYLAFQDPHLLISDSINYRLLLLNVLDNTYVWWQLPGIADPFGVRIDAQGNLWYADLDNQSIAELDPDTNWLTAYSIPMGSYPRMIAVQGMRVWYTVYGENIGALDTTAADHIHTQLITGTGSLTPDCSASPIGPYVSGNLTIYSDTLEWTSRSYEMAMDANGWQIYQIPKDGTYPDERYASPWGIAYQNGKVWVADNGRQKLIQIDAPPETATIQACKHKDADGDVSTLDDRSPVAGWTMTLSKNAVLVGTQLTGTDGCALWSGLELGMTYTVAESARPGWTPLGDIQCNLGTISTGDRYSCEFVNYDESSYVFLPLILR